MRILLLTDSLGCPRNGVKVEDTWTDRIIKKWSSDDIVFYTYCQHGLYSQNIQMDYISEIEPDVIICQIGIVDATRRAMTRTELDFFGKIPLVSKVVNRICKRYHYVLSRIRNIHYSKKRDFSRFFSELVGYAKKNTIIIPIAQPGEYLIKTVYRIKEDVSIYNELIENAVDEKTVIINPYKNHVADEYVLEDGHHLNKLGLDLVFNEVDKALDRLLDNEI